jgi:hypothetical protein
VRRCFGRWGRASRSCSTRCSERAEDIRAILNAGFSRGEGSVWRCVGQGSKQDEVAFPVFGPKVVIGIGRLMPETVHDRSIVIRLQKATKATTLEKLRERRPPADAEPLKARVSAWATDHLEVLKEVEPLLPDELDARGQDIAEPLIAIADLLGCGTDARAAIVALRTGESADNEDSLVLLRDIRTFFTSERMASNDVLHALVEIEGSPWAARWADERDRKKAPTQLARMLREFDIRPHKLRLAGHETSTRGYRRTDFDDAFERYLPPSDQPPGRSNLEQPEHPDAQSDQAERSPRNTGSDVPSADPVEGPVETAMFRMFRAEESRQVDVFRAQVAAGASTEVAARAAGLDPQRIPVRLATAAPEILAGIPHKQLVDWEGEGRIPRGTAALGRHTESIAATDPLRTNAARPSHPASHPQLSLEPFTDRRAP